MIRLRLSHTVLGLLVGAVFVLACFHVAYAQALPDPMTDPGASLSLFAKLYHSGAYVPLAIVVAFCIARIAGDLVKRPNLAHWIAIIAGILALFVPAAIQGQTPNVGMLFGFAGPIIALLAPGWTPKQGS